MPSLISSLYRFGQFRLESQSRVLRRGGQLVALSPKAFEVLLAVVQSGGKTLSKDELMQAVWPDSFVEESNLTQTVFMLRKALGENAEQRYILTVPGRGYRFAAEVKQVPEDEPTAVEAEGPAPKPGAVLIRPSSKAEEVNRSWRRMSLVFALGLVLMAATAAYVRWSGPRKESPAVPARIMLAVLPFQNLTGDPAQEYFSDGMTEEMITQLGNISPQHLGIIARTSVMHYKGGQPPLDQIGHELGVQYVLEGSVRRDSGKIRITAQLIQTKDQTHVWAREYDRELNGLFVLQGEIGHEIADEIQLTLAGDKSVATQPALSPRNYEAYDLYLKGQFFFNKRTAATLRKAIGILSKLRPKIQTMPAPMLVWRTATH